MLKFMLCSKSLSKSVKISQGLKLAAVKVKQLLMNKSLSKVKIQIKQYFK